MAVKTVWRLLTVLAYCACSTVVMERRDIGITSNQLIQQTNASAILPKKYVFGGEDAEIGKYPWMVHLRTVIVTREDWYTRTESYECGGSLISDRHVLTAAHCIHKERMKHYHNLEIYLGEYERGSHPKDCAEGKCVWNSLVHPDKIIVHPHFDSGKNGNNDIALVRVENRIHFTPSIQPIPLLPFDVDTPEFVGRPLVVAGWGVINDKDENLKILQATIMRLLSKSECRRIVWPPVGPSSFCLMSIEGFSVCSGDSGGPAAMYYRNKYYLAGVASMGPGVCGGPGPSRFSNVFRHLKWIHSHMNRV